MERPRQILPALVIGQLCSTSLWFAGNAVAGDLRADLGVDVSVAWLTSAVQLGFIAGTLGFAVTGLADRFESRTTFLVAALAGAAANLGTLAADTSEAVLLSRLAVGLCLAGIYPIGMRAAAGWYAQGLGRALGLLVGALVLGTAFPHLLRGLGAEVSWRAVLVGTSVAAAAGGLLVYAMVPDGPHTRRGARFAPAVLPRLFGLPAFRASALGYFGHMWELYTFWALAPALLVARGLEGAQVSLGAFAIVGIGALGCAVGGLASERVGSGLVAASSLLVSGLCCLLAPWALTWSTPAFAAFLAVWGLAVVTDSPQFSTLTARAAPPEWVGTGLTVVTSIGFGLTVVSVQVAEQLPLATALMMLAVGPAAGLAALVPSLVRARA
ncbi:MAG: MFS transporter [Proteobacteria bacterium]|nr:MFS transporter [Pseudomonadota bacterium]